MPALVFDCDGVLADTERDGHRVAFNQMFREFGVPIEWDEVTYRSKLAIGGGKERMAAELTPDFVAAQGIPTDPQQQAELVAQWHKRKTAIYKELVAAGRLPTRPGIRRLITEAQDAGWLLGVASTSAPESVHAILEQAVGKDRADRFDVFLAGDVVPRKKPAPDIYALAVERLDVPGSDVLVVEDSRNGLLAATYAGLRCVVTVNAYTEDEPNDEAVLVVTSLGDPDGERMQVIANRGAAQPGAYVTLADLAACLASPGPTAHSTSTTTLPSEEPA
jgi:HAD superfamily hydrolase (TIGR01509 family)